MLPQTLNLKSSNQILPQEPLKSWIFLAIQKFRSTRYHTLWPNSSTRKRTTNNLLAHNQTTHFFWLINNRLASNLGNWVGFLLKKTNKISSKRPCFITVSRNRHLINEYTRARSENNAPKYHLFFLPFFSLDFILSSRIALSMNG